MPKLSKQGGDPIQRRPLGQEHNRYVVLDGKGLRVCDLMPDGTLLARAHYWHKELARKRKP